MKLKNILRTIIIVIEIIILSGCVKNQQIPLSADKNDLQGTIFFLGLTDEVNRGYLVSMPERNIQEIGLWNQNNSYAISNDGRLIAMACYDDDNAICIFNTSLIVPRVKIVPESDQVGFGNIFFEDIKRLPIPSNCIEINKQTSNHLTPLQQISWSHDNSKISIVCGDKYKESELCIIEIDGKSKCFPETTEKRITYASWSPIEDILAVSSTTYSDPTSVTYLFNPHTGDFDMLFSGFAPAWSPSGERIASFNLENPNSFPFIYILQVYSFEKKEMSILLPNKQSEKAGFSLWPTVDERNEDCTISWSLDENQLVFSSRLRHFNFSTLLLYDFSSEEIQFLFDPDLLRAIQVYPQWSPFELINE
mgnify:FL=1